MRKEPWGTNSNADADLVATRGGMGMKIVQQESEEEIGVRHPPVKP
jgi:hypothetical protein